MQKQNYAEYEFLRTELLNLKNCVTTYIGFVVGGSGVAFFGLAVLARSTKPLSIIGAICLLISMVISLVLLILFYKFNSHNRFAGYCKLLSQEKLEADIRVQIDEQYFSWEICMDLLRESDLNKDILINKCDSLEIEEFDTSTIKDTVSKFYDTSDRPRQFILAGINLLYQTLEGKEKNESWNFPVYVVTVFFFLVISFLLIGTSTTISTLLIEDVHTILKFIQFISVLLVIFLQSHIWNKFFKKLISLMKGSATVDAFCWKFLPIRYEYIKSKNEHIRYHINTFK